jgi:hypothetical protein
MQNRKNRSSFSIEPLEVRCLLSETPVVNEPPVLAFIPTQEVFEGDLLALQVEAFDPEFGQITFSLDSAPAGASIDPDSGLLLFAAPDDGVYSVTVRATDSGLPALFMSQTFDIIASNQSPEVVPNDERNIIVGQSVTLTNAFFDFGLGDTHTGSFTWGDDAISAGVINEVNGSGTISGTHTYAAAGTYSVEVSVTDDDGATSSTTQTVRVITALEAIQRIIAEVDGLVGNGLTQTQADSLINGKLAQAVKFLTRDETDQAAHHIEQFVSKVDTLSAEQQALLDGLVSDAMDIIAYLEQV